MPRAKILTPQWEAWAKSVAHHLAMIERYEAMLYPVQGEEWKVNTIAHHERALAALRAAEPVKWRGG